MSILIRSLFKDAADAAANIEAFASSPLPDRFTGDHRKIAKTILEFYDSYRAPPSIEAIRDRLDETAAKVLAAEVATRSPVDAVEYRAKLDLYVARQNQRLHSEALEIVSQVARGEVVEIKETIGGQLYIHKLASQEDAFAYLDRQKTRIAEEWPLRGAIALKTRKGDTITKTYQEYLAYPLLPSGQLVLLEGDGGAGKSTVAGAIATGYSRGESLIGDIPGLGEPREVIWFSTEESVESGIIPRLEAQGADLSQFHFLPAGEAWTTAKMPELLALIDSMERPPIIILDALKDFLPGVKDYEETSVRQCLSPLALACHSRGVTIIGIRHWRKGTGSASSRGAGSMAWRNFAHTTLACGLLGEARYIAASKNRSAPMDGAWQYQIDSVQMDGAPHPIPRLKWVRHHANIKADDLAMATPDTSEERSALEEAREFLLDELRDGEKPSKDVESAAKAADISATTLKRAKKELCRSIKRGSTWYMALLEPPPPSKATPHLALGDDFFDDAETIPPPLKKPEPLPDKAEAEKARLARLAFWEELDAELEAKRNEANR